MRKKWFVNPYKDQKEQVMAEAENKMAKRLKFFEDQVASASQVAQDAINEMEKWRRKRISLG